MLAYLYALQCVHISKQRGHLATVLGYDDVAYIYSSLDLAQALHEKGFGGWGDHFGRFSLHSPYSELLGGLTFYIWGFSFRTAYVANFLLVSLFLFFILYFIRRLKTPVQFLIFGCFLLLPFATMCVTEYRPDLFWATVLGFTAIYLVTRRDFFERMAPTVTFGFLAALSYMAKPSTFAMTVLTLFLAMGGRLVLEFYRPQPPRAAELAKKAGLRFLIIAGMSFLLTLPYNYFFGRAILDYFIYGVFGAGRKIFDAFAHAPWNFYLWGPAYDSNLAHNGTMLILVAILVIVAVRKFLTRYDRTELEICLILLMVPYAVSADAPIVSPFLAGAFYGGTIFLLAHIFGRYVPLLFGQMAVELRPPVPEGEPPAKVRKFQLSPTQQGAYCAAFLVLVFLTSYVWPPYCDSGGSGHYMRGLYNNIYRYFARTPFPTTINMTQASPLTREDLLIWFKLHYHQVPVVDTCGGALTIDEAWTDVQKDNMVIAQDTGMKGTTPWLKSEKFQDQIVSRLVHSPDYKLDWSYGDGEGKNVYVFRRVKDLPVTTL